MATFKICQCPTPSQHLIQPPGPRTLLGSSSVASRPVSHMLQAWPTSLSSEPSSPSGHQVMPNLSPRACRPLLTWSNSQALPCFHDLRELACSPPQRWPPGLVPEHLV